MIKILFALLIVVTSGPAYSENNFKIGLATWSGYPESIRGFKAALEEEGLVEGKNVTFIEGKISADKAIQETVAKNFKEQQVDLVYSLTTPGTVIMKEGLPETTPIVFSIVTYPADSGLIESFEYSGNNLVGTSNFVPIRHYFQLINWLVPDANKVAIFRRDGEPNSKIQSVNMRRLLKKKGLKGIDVAVSDLDELKSESTKLIGKVDVFMTTTDTLMQSGGEELLIASSLEHAIPLLSSNKKGIKKGATFGPVADFYTISKISGQMAAEILLNDRRPTDLESKLQDPPQYLLNKSSIEKLKIKVPKKLANKITWAE